MAKKSATGNKSAAIREALQAKPDWTPKQVAEYLQESGFKVTPAYVSIVKYNLSKSSGAQGRKVRVKRAGAKIKVKVLGASSFIGNGFVQMESALQFIQACGGLEQAKSVLAQVEQIRAVV